MKNIIMTLVLILSLLACKKGKTLNKPIINKKNLYLAVVNDPKGITVRNQPSLNGKSIGGFAFNDIVFVIKLTGKIEKIKSWDNKLVSGQWVKIDFSSKNITTDTCYVFDKFLDYKSSSLNYVYVNQTNDSIIKSKAIIALENEITTQKIINDSILKYNSKILTTIDSLQQIETNYINKRITDLFMKDSMKFINGNKVITTLFNELNIDSVSFLVALRNNGYILNKYNNTYYRETKERIPFLNYVWNNFDRNKKSIKNFFTNQKKNLIYSLFRNSNVYTSSGMENSVKGLLLAYKEISTKEDMLKQIYEKSLNNKDYSGKLNLIDNITSKKMQLLLSNDTLATNSIQYRAFQLYSFWARRHQEKNKEIVYELLKEFYENVQEQKKIENFFTKNGLGGPFL